MFQCFGPYKAPLKPTVVVFVGIPPIRNIEVKKVAPLSQFPEGALNITWKTPFLSANWRNAMIIITCFWGTKGVGEQVVSAQIPLNSTPAQFSGHPLTVFNYLHPILPTTRVSNSIFQYAVHRALQNELHSRMASIGLEQGLSKLMRSPSH